MWTVYFDSKATRIWVASDSARQELCEKAGFIKVGTLDMGVLFLASPLDAAAEKAAVEWAQKKGFMIVRS